MPIELPLLPLRGQSLEGSPQPELTAGSGQQPADLNRRLKSQLRSFGAAPIGEQIERRGSAPAPEHQGAHAWCAISRHGGQLQPAVLEGTPPLPLPGSPQQGTPRRQMLIRGHVPARGCQ